MARSVKGCKYAKKNRLDRDVAQRVRNRLKSLVEASTTLEGEELRQRLNNLRPIVTAFEPKGGLQSLRLFELSYHCNFAQLPYGDGWLNQPEWWLDDLESFMLVMEYESLKAKLPVIPLNSTTFDSI